MSQDRTQPAPRRISDWAALPLEAGGRCLIEASAGTGKTWTISVLYLRLLLERGLSPTQVVVTTFTDAAADELRERLRGRLLWATRRAESAVQGERFHVDEDTPADEAWLSRRWAAGRDTSARDDLRRLRLALADLDLAPVGTLHGLCRRILSDFPFECASTFGLGDMVAGDTLNAELIDDLWRGLAQSPDPLPAGEQAWYDAGRGALARALNCTLRAGITVRVVDPDEVALAMDAAWVPRIREWVGNTRFRSASSVLPKAMLGLADYIEAGNPAVDLDGKICADLCKPLESQLKKGEDVAAMEADEVLVYARWAAALLGCASIPAKSRALAGFRARLLERRARALLERGQLTFDALIERVHDALHGEHGSTLADRLFETWPATLVDEFQDTDQLQYGILDRIHSDPDGQPRGRLVMIGDPKQAIYGFRGGDVHAYLRAMRSADTRLHLTTNFRSASRLVAALNGLYALAGERLSQGEDSEIAYEVVQPGPVADRSPYTIAHHPVANPLVLHFDPAPAKNNGDQRRAALKACANAIAALLSEGSHRIGQAPVGPGDIAVLLPTNNDITILRRELGRRQVPCVGAGKSSVFRTDVARELQVLLHGVHQAQDDGLLRAAFATRLYGLDFDALRALDTDLHGWNQHVERLHRWRERWHTQGVLAVVQAIIVHAADRLLAEADGADGERALTDLRHLGELLQARAHKLPGEAELLAWMGRQRRGEGDDDSDAADEMQLRIESDAKRVRLMTLHASKGLEFPIVFLPLMWAQQGKAETLPVVHDDDGIGRVLDLGGPHHAEACRRAAESGQDERFRVLYVALTRARHACHVFCLPIDRPKAGNTSNPGLDPERSALDATLARVLDAGQTDALAALPGVEWRPGPWPVEPLVRLEPHQPDAEAMLGVRTEPPPRPLQQRYSFSALTRHHPASNSEDSAAADEAGRDAAAVPDATAVAAAEPHPDLQRLEAVKGTRIGNAIHMIFEDREIGRPLADQAELVRQALKQHDVNEPRLPSERLVPLLAQRIDAALAAELLPGLRLGDLPAQSLRAEMGFHFPLDAVSLDALRRAAQAHGEPTLVPAGPAHTLRGLMTGKIDLTLEHDGRFHVLDYKGNWLGVAVADYQGDALTRAMDHHHYRFQALIYTVAVHRYLRERVPGYDPAQHLGEGIYLFVRAAGLAPGAGVWAHRFSDALIEAIDAALAGEREVAA